MSVTFEPIKRPPVRSKQKRLGGLIIRRIYKRNINEGGTFTEITGAPSAAKTSVMLSFGNKIMKNDELVFWSSSYGSPLQFFLKMDNKSSIKYNILIKKGMDIEFWDRYENKKVNLPVQEFDTFDELYKLSEKDKLNCPFFGDRTEWTKFIEFLMGKGRWHTVLIDEISELTPADTGGDVLKRIRYFANHTLGQSRKCGLTIVCNTQSTTDTAHQVRKKLNIRIFLPGAKVDKYTRVKQRAVDNLNEDHVHGSQAYISASGRFGVIRFRDIYKPVSGLSIEARTSFKSDIYDTK